MNCSTDKMVCRFTRNLQLRRKTLIVFFLNFLFIENTCSVSLLPDPTTGIGTHKRHHYKQLSEPQSPTNDQPQVHPHPTPTARDLNRSVMFGRDVIDRLHRLEQSLLWSDVDLKVGTPAHEYMVNAMPEDAAIEQAKHAHVAAKATLHLMGIACHRGTPRKYCSRHLQSAYHLHNTSLSLYCPAHQPRCPTIHHLQPYRTFDGSCNNIQSATLGRANTQYKRLLFPDYLDGVQEVRRSVVGKKRLPSARQVSVGLVGSSAGVEEQENGLTLMGMVWAQLVSMDVSHTVVNRMIHTGKPIDCCSDSSDTLTPRYLHPFCQAIEVPSDDVYYAKHGIKCMNYVRSIVAVNSDCTFGPYEQLNQATHYLDASHIYGNDEKRANSLRVLQHGQLLTTFINGKAMLPIIKNEICSEKVCFSSGDPRVNFNPQSTALFTILLREHNRIAEELAKLNPVWNDEQLYQMARKIVIAQIQHITYENWLPLIIGKNFVRKMGISKYVESTDPSISNSFATAAFRFIKSLMKSNISLLEEDRSTNVSINILQYFNDPSILEQPDYLDSLIRSMATEKSEKADFYYSKDLTNDLYGNGNKTGLDIVSLDVQKGRDHGLPSYTAYRSKCGLPMVNTFHELTDFISKEAVGSLAKIYSNPNDIDLLVGGMLEKSYGESLLGPTFSCIIADQMKRTRQGDRYFYTHLMQPQPFTEKQLQSIKLTTLAKIICNNVDGIERMQRDVFQIISKEGNILENCQQLPDLNIWLWKE